MLADRLLKLNQSTSKLEVTQTPAKNYPLGTSPTKKADKPASHRMFSLEGSGATGIVNYIEKTAEAVNTDNSYTNLLLKGVAKVATTIHTKGRLSLKSMRLAT